MMLVEMLTEAGCPPGVVNVIHGSVDTVNFICDAPAIKAIAFFGANPAVLIYYLNELNQGQGIGKLSQKY